MRWKHRSFPFSIKLAIRREDFRKVYLRTPFILFVRLVNDPQSLFVQWLIIRTVLRETRHPFDYSFQGYFNGLVRELVIRDEDEYN